MSRVNHAVIPFPLVFNQVDIEERFQRAMELEVSGSISEATEIYREVLADSPGHAKAAVNLGSICYGRKEFMQAEALFRRATESDPDYALAFYNLGSTLDELRMREEAVEALERAIRISPTYADAHYNLAIVLNNLGLQRKALPHWQAYCKLDRTEPWASHARVMVGNILRQEKLVVCHGGLR